MAIILIGYPFTFHPFFFFLLFKTPKKDEQTSLPAIHKYVRVHVRVCLERYT